MKKKENEMETMIGLMLVIVIIAAIYYFSESLNTIADYTNDDLTTTYSEKSLKLIKRDEVVAQKIDEHLKQ